MWSAVVERPIGELIEAGETDDTVRGVLLTDAVIGTFSYAHDPSLRQNRCFLYHVIGNGTGEWRVPVGGMGAVAASWPGRLSAGAELRTAARVTQITLATATRRGALVGGGTLWPTSYWRTALLRPWRACSAATPARRWAARSRSTWWSAGCRD